MCNDIFILLALENDTILLEYTVNNANNIDSSGMMSPISQYDVTLKFNFAIGVAVIIVKPIQHYQHFI